MHKIAEVEIQNDILIANKKLAKRNQRLLDKAGVFAIDFLGAVGSGKTTLIEKLIENMDYSIGVIAGDIISKFDAERVKKYNIPVVGLNTGKECHLDAHLVEHGLEDLPLDKIDLLFIENVGNLICPVDFDLGSHMRIVIISATEGDDTVQKHPLIFKEADLVIINKVDLADAVGADIDKMVEDVSRINPHVKVIKTSLKNDEGIKEVIEAILEAM
ncbi:hydrogenase nickel incorporation protein HypB [Methanothermobacter tenebrarum]|uniref:Hydrogenase accessory protein HypB n=1 Tax=Methanothermobacter tenebrarum TaxID=680118 RepID=A0A328P8A1_9EURY|nr:hydrogenase nickel incorporation protein HypB [Methanothermobacter tenebrarum]MBC7100041.1 hydrogenase nickel incorporation protein HypB [Methanobacteriales archaeon]MBC7118406.1 hydrogenase nickel incorporation protein HypB [Methanobacteriaceae archaeon]NPV64830.1 hydrogenase nickel incorporation protein HypB [Methanobacteriaceae archaeon]RAO78567.1 hydrogenase accessory protein HypB [Methanothermobacter tenebrarum]